MLGTTCRRAPSRFGRIGRGRPAGFLVALITAAAVSSSCGTSELDVEPTFDGVWRVAALRVEGTDVGLQGQAVQIEIDTGQLAVRGRTNCQEFFGSYTLVDTGSSTGEAGFTVPSPAADPSCDTVDSTVHESTVEALELVTQWSREDSTLTLLTAGVSTDQTEPRTQLVLSLAG